MIFWKLLNLFISNSFLLKAEIILEIRIQIIDRNGAEAQRNIPILKKVKPKLKLFISLLVSNLNII